MRRPSVAASVRIAACGLALLVLVAGCERKPKFVPAGPDSTQAPVDSLTAGFRSVLRAWETGPPDEAGVASTAETLREELARRAPSEWSRRAQRLLDSLGVGAEIASADCVLGVNFFARSDPGAGSWPYLYWCGPDGPRHQAIEGKGLKLSAMVARGTGGSAKGAAGVAALFQRRAAGGYQPMLMAWSADSSRARWRLAQTLGPDSLGGVGSGSFAGSGGDVELTTRTYMPSAYFDECPTCPHAFRVHKFAWREDGFERTASDLVPSPYTTFVQFIKALAEGDLRRADELVADPYLTDRARMLSWDRRAGKWRIAPGVEETPERMVFYRGAKEAFAVRFTSRGGQWVVAGFDTTARVLGIE